VTVTQTGACDLSPKPWYDIEELLIQLFVYLSAKVYAGESVTTQLLGLVVHGAYDSGKESKLVSRSQPSMIKNQSNCESG
jgi:hypothetical protein